MRAMPPADADRPALLPVAVLVGGRGTRLGELARDTPKALVPVAGGPFVFHQLRLLAAHGARRVVLCVGHLGEQIADEVGDGARFGLDVDYAFDGPEPVGTAAALRQARSLLGERFLVTYGDAYLRADHGAVQDAFRRGGDPGLMTVVQNDGRWVTSNAVFHDGRVTAYDKRVPPPGARWVDYGLLAFEAERLRRARRRRPLRRLPRARGAGSARRVPRPRAVLRDRHARGARGDRGVPPRAVVTGALTRHERRAFRTRRLPSPPVKALLVSFYFPPAGGGGVQRPLKLAQYLPAMGVETHVLAPDDPRWIHRDDELRMPSQAWVHRARYVGVSGGKPSEVLAGKTGRRAGSRRRPVSSSGGSWCRTRTRPGR